MGMGDTVPRQQLLQASADCDAMQRERDQANRLAADLKAQLLEERAMRQGGAASAAGGACKAAEQLPSDLSDEALTLMFQSFEVCTRRCTVRHVWVHTARGARTALPCATRAPRVAWWVGAGQNAQRWRFRAHL